MHKLSGVGFHVDESDNVAPLDPGSAHHTTDPETLIVRRKGELSVSTANFYLVTGEGRKPFRL